MDTLFSGLITSKMRIRILMRLFLNADQQAYLRELVEEFDASPGQVNDELKQLSQAGLLEARKDGRQIYYRANKNHSLFPELQSMVKKTLGMNHIIESILQRLGKLEQAFLIDDYAEGKDSGLIDLVIVGQVDKKNLDDLVIKAERYIKRKIRTLVITRSELETMKEVFKNRSKLILWESQPTNPP
jgi:DNA-binding transcriptional ArsR family regulator